MKTATALQTSLAASLLLVGCTKQPARDNTQTAGKEAASEPAPAPAAASSSEPREQGDPHLIVFADRTSQAYLLLLPEDRAELPSRESLQTLVKASLASKQDEPELRLLLELIGTAPVRDDQAGSPDGAPRTTRDLLGMNIDVLSATGPRGAVGADALRDPVLTRELQPDERASLAGRGKALLLRAEYRNQYAVRGLRLLQTLVRIVALDRGALIHDPDTGETMGPAAFTRRRLQTSLGNVADQIAVVPFPDRRHDGKIRLTTRGMRRFGSVDLELDGLPRDPRVLQRATDLLYGLALSMVRVGEFDVSGYAVELDELITIDAEDVVRAYGTRGDKVPRCTDCPAEVEVHLVERAAEAHDPDDHVVARVVAPRPLSDAEGYDQTQWIAAALADLFG